tara:strand:- start:1590 stop:1865 length:276 start_codon:yes stop_codon:yes gene_type:complete
MAKTKEKVVDLKPKAEKITEEQLKELQSVVNDNNELQFRVGAVEMQKHQLLNELDRVKVKIMSMQSKFKEEYGTFDISLQDGSINYPKDGE